METFDGVPIFVLGVPRSGTTLVASMLGGHSRARAPAEPWTMLMLDQLGAVHGLHPAGAELVGARAATHFDAAARDALLAAMARVYYGALGAAGTETSGPRLRASPPTPRPCGR
jgi:hypothetical protein